MTLPNVTDRRECIKGKMTLPKVTEWMLFFSLTQYKESKQMAQSIPKEGSEGSS
jgi:hypothetical protein